MYKYLSNLKYQFNNKKETLTLQNIFSVLHKLEILLAANIPVIQCIEMLEKSEESISIKKLLFYTKKDLYSGKRISESFYYFKDYIEPFFYHLLRLGEETGKLLICIKQLVNYLKIKIEFRKKIKQALIYPAIIITIAFLILLSLIIFIIPEFANLFQESNIKLPFYTKVLFSFSIFMKNNLIYLSIFLILLSVLTYKVNAFYFFKKKLNLFLMSLKFTEFYRDKCCLIQFCQQLATCLSAGLPIIESLILFNKADTSTTMEVPGIIEQIKTGSSLSLAMDKYNFPIFVVEMIKIGESTGMLEQVLFYLAEYYQDELNVLFDRIKTIIEPLIICILGVLIGCLVISIYMPIFNLGSLYR